MTETHSFDGLPHAERRVFVELFRSLERPRGWQTDPEALLDRWRLMIEELQPTYEFGLDDYTNDLAVREILQDILDADLERRLVAAREVLADLDEEFRGATVELNQPIFAAGRAGADPIKYFYYFRVPRTPGEEMMEDLVRMKLVCGPGDLSTS